MEHADSTGSESLDLDLDRVQVAFSAPDEVSITAVFTDGLKPLRLQPEQLDLSVFQVVTAAFGLGAGGGVSVHFGGSSVEQYTFTELGIGENAKLEVFSNPGIIDTDCGGMYAYAPDSKRDLERREGFSNIVQDDGIPIAPGGTIQLAGQHREHDESVFISTPVPEHITNYNISMDLRFSTERQRDMPYGSPPHGDVGRHGGIVFGVPADKLYNGARMDRESSGVGGQRIGVNPDLLALTVTPTVTPANLRPPLSS